jgi:protein-S-isoprenylcysteine O-methyltransferase Ste14
MAFAFTLAFWVWIFLQSFSPLVNLVCIFGTIVVIFPTVWIGRRLLDIKPTIDQVIWVTTAVHTIVMTLFGTAVLKAIQTGDTWRGLVIPFPRSLAIALVYITATFTMFTIANLAMRGFGAPLIIPLSRRVVTDWLYSWTRNPMILSTLACLVAMGLWFQSTLFIVWVLGLVAPSWIVFLKVYEERELEIRFGDAYRTYKAKTPFLWPKKPSA